LPTWEIIVAFVLPDFTSPMALTASKVAAHGTVTGIVADGV
jgi:hypothetical protein